MSFIVKIFELRKFLKTFHTCYLLHIVLGILHLQIELKCLILNLNLYKNSLFIYYVYFHPKDKDN